MRSLAAIKAAMQSTPAETGGITFGWTEGDAIDVDLEDYH
jgi:hypothetical protein